MNRQELLEKAAALPKITEYDKWIEMEVKRHKPLDCSELEADSSKPSECCDDINDFTCAECGEKYPCELMRDISKELV